MSKVTFELGPDVTSAYSLIVTALPNGETRGELRIINKKRNGEMAEGIVDLKGKGLGEAVAVLQGPFAHRQARAKMIKHDRSLGY